MRQKIELVVVADIDVDEWIPNQEKLEKLLSAAVQRETKMITGTPDTVDVFIEYGEPV